MPPSRIDKALLLLPPFDQLLGSTRDRISRLKHRYPCDDELITHLMHMDPRLVALVPYLVWIPYEQFFDVQKVGQGGFATVWKARFKANQGFDVILALKEIDVSFQQEIVLQTVISLQNNSRIMNVIGLSKDPESGRNLIVMAFAKGGSLEKRLDETELRGPWSDTFGAALRVSTALASLHLIGVTHNDLHPGNIGRP
ncbi:kinase-like domain-containing protein [Jimgerdemannia flammicorona]|uniref:Kinase-like domain-containing protein n=1 Tax=Jimgerdemannia flammicorona TaxID=994334 RepID=A0A433QL56_9FUNG|nr:kinase-like domain-containing protein [Jimgerdemannia flammicorona]